MNYSIFNQHSPRLAVSIAFFINGALLATWVSRIPDIQIKLDLSEGDLGIILLGLAVGVLVALSLAGGLIARFGSRFVTIAGAVTLGIALPLLSLMPNAVALWLALFVFGAAMSAMDVAMNAQGVIVEQRSKMRMMSSFHAAFSIGGLAGALLGAGMAWLSITVLSHFILASIIFVGVAMIFAGNLVYVEGETSEGESLFRLPPRPLWLLGAIAFSTAIGEGAMADWSAVYLRQTIQSSAGTAALGFAAFSLTMTIGRLTGDWLTTRFDAVFIVRIGGLIAMVGLLAAIFTNQPIVVLIGFAGVGAGLANVIPLAFSTAGNFPGIPSGVGIAGVASIGYAGFLAGPPLIGLVAEVTSLRIGLLLVAIFASTLIFMAQVMRPISSEVPIEEVSVD